MTLPTRTPRRARPRTVAAALLGAAALALAGCSAADDSDAAAPTDSTDTATTADEGPAEAVEIPDSPVGRQTQWVLDTLAAEDGPTAEEAQERFDDAFLTQVPADQVGAVFAQLRAMGPFTVESYEEGENAARAYLQGTERFALDVVVDDEGRMSGLLISPAAPVPEVTTPAEAADALAGAATAASMLLATVEGDGDAARCTPVEQREADAQRPIGSQFKLYVLGAVVQAVEDGTLTWDDELTLSEEAKSLPSGTLQNEPAGTVISVRDAAAQMIAISDNTATDLLIGAVGREAVEAALTEMGAAQPSANIPFLTTREMFQLSFSDPDLRAGWTQASGLPSDVAGAPQDQNTGPGVDDAQRAFLAELPDWDLTIDPAVGEAAFWPNGLDWFATADDLCAAHAHLQGLAETEAGEPVREILAANPGVELPEAEYVAYKGGSSVGEIGGSWYVERPDGTREVLVLLAAGADASGVPDSGWMSGVAQQALGGEAP